MKKKIQYYLSPLLIIAGIIFISFSIFFVCLESQPHGKSYKSNIVSSEEPYIKEISFDKEYANVEINMNSQTIYMPFKYKISKGQLYFNIDDENTLVGDIDAYHINLDQESFNEIFLDDDISLCCERNLTLRICAITILVISGLIIIIKLAIISHKYKRDKKNEENLEKIKLETEEKVKLEIIKEKSKLEPRKYCEYCEVEVDINAKKCPNCGSNKFKIK